MNKVLTIVFLVGGVYITSHIIASSLHNETCRKNIIKEIERDLKDEPKGKSFFLRDSNIKCYYKER